MDDPTEHVEIPIVPFHPRWDRSAFSCGHSVLDDWLKGQAGQQEKSDNTRTFLAVDPTSTRVVGYYSTTTYRLDLAEAAAALGAGKRRYPIPALLLARLAVDSTCQGSGVGRQVLGHAVRNIARASQVVGFEMVVVHAIDQEAVAFYVHYGFVPFEVHPQHLFLTTKRLRATVAAEDR